MVQRFIFILLFISAQGFAQSPTTWTSKGIGGGGALFSPSINPANTNEMYIACYMGGLYHSTNQGGAWTMCPHTQIRGGCYTKVLFTNNASIRYAIDYRANGINDQMTPAKTIDGGVTWTKLSGNPDDTEPLYSLYVNYANPNQVVLNQYSKIYFSNDGGTTFSLVYTALNSGAGIKVSGAYWDGSTIYLGTNDGIVRSTNGGTSFSLWATTGISSGQVITSFAGAKNGTNTRFFILTSNVADVYNGDDNPGIGYEIFEHMKGVYSMDNVSGTWVNKMGNLNSTTQYGKYLRMAENNTDVVYIAGQTDAGIPIIVKTNNAGTLWATVFNTTINQNIFTAYCGDGGDLGWTWAETLFGLNVSPTDANVLLCSDYGFVHKSTDGGITWHQSYTAASDEHTSNASTPTLASYHSAGDLNQISVWQVMWFDSLNMWACSSGIKGTRSVDGGNAWSFNYTNHSENSSYRIVKNNTTATWYMATSSVHDMYQSTRLANAQLDNANNSGAVKMSTDKGATWTTMHDFSDIVVWVATDPTNANRLYASVVNSGSNGGIWVTDNANAGASSTWTKLQNPPRTEGHPYNIVVLNDGKVLASYSGHRNPGFTASSGVFLFDPISSSSPWSDRSDLGMQYWTQDVVVDPHDATQNTWYACVYEGWGVSASQGVGGIYKTTNRGISWTKIWSNERCFSVTISPTNANEMYVSTEYHGLLYCSNLSSSSPTFTSTNYPFRQPLRVFYNPYQAGEIWVTGFGGGMMKGGGSSTIGIQETIENKDILIYPNPAQTELNIEMVANNQMPTDIMILDILGNKMSVKTEIKGQKIKCNTSSLKAGIYFLTFTYKGQKITRKFSING